MAANDLTTVARVNLWISGAQAAPPTNPIVTAQEITRISGIITQACFRGSLLSQTFRDVMDGQGGGQRMLRRWPVTSITSLVIGNQAYTPAPDPFATAPIASTGGPWYALEPWDGLPPGRPQLLEVTSGLFFRGRQNVAVVYTAGYLATGDAQTIGADGHVTPANVNGLCARDAGVIYVATGLPLVSVASAPAVGQYVAPNPFDTGSPTDYYQFNTAEAGVAVALSYSFVPWALEGIACEWTAERLMYKTRIGQRSKSLATQETISYDTSAIPAFLKMAMQPFIQVVPIP